MHMAAPVIPLSVVLSGKVRGNRYPSSFGVGGGVGALVEGVLEFGVAASSLGELIFEDDDAGGCFEGVAVVDEVADAGGEAQLVAGVAAVPALGALWRQ